MDLWASPTLRTGGEDVAHALALMGVRPVWDHATTRVTGFEVLPLALLDRPAHRRDGARLRRIPRHLPRHARAARPGRTRGGRARRGRTTRTRWPPPAAAARRPPGSTARRRAATAPAPPSHRARRRLGRRAATSDAPTSRPAATPTATARDRTRISPPGSRQADAYLHAFDVAERDLFDGDAAVDAMGGFAAAASLGGGSPTLYSLDVSCPERPKARTAREDAARLIRGRLADPRWIAGQLRHGYRGAQELAQGLDAVFVLAATSDAVTDADFDRLYAAWIADADVFDAPARRQSRGDAGDPGALRRGPRPRPLAQPPQRAAGRRADAGGGGMSAPRPAPPGPARGLRAAAAGARVSPARCPPATGSSRACIRRSACSRWRSPAPWPRAHAGFGNGHIDVTARANLQIRGVSDATRTPPRRAAGSGRARRRAHRRRPAAPDAHEPARRLRLGRSGSTCRARPRHRGARARHRRVCRPRRWWWSRAPARRCRRSRRLLRRVLSGADTVVIAAATTEGRRDLATCDASARPRPRSRRCWRPSPHRPPPRCATCRPTNCEAHLEMPRRAPSRRRVRLSTAGAGGAGSVIPGCGEALLARSAGLRTVARSMARASLSRCAFRPLHAAMPSTGSCAIADALGADDDPPLADARLRAAARCTRSRRRSRCWPRSPPRFIIAPDDPRRGVAACTGAPACASGSTPTLRGCRASRGGVPTVRPEAGADGARLRLRQGLRPARRRADLTLVGAGRASTAPSSAARPAMRRRWTSLSRRCWSG